MILSNPVFVGDTLYAESTVLSKRRSRSRIGQGVVTVMTRGLNQRGAEVLRWQRSFLVPTAGGGEGDPMIPPTARGAFHLPLLPLGDDILPLAAFLREHYRARAQVPPRGLILRQAPFAAFGVMPVFCPHHRLFTAKVATFAPGNGTGPAVNAILCVFDGVSGQPLTLLEGTQLTNYKCAAISAMVTDFCAVDNARVLAVIGSGVQAWQQVRAVMAVRAIAELRLFSPNGAHVADFANRVRQRWPGHLTLVCPGSAAQAVRGADIVCTATTCATPLFPPEVVAPHAHINYGGPHPRQP